MDRVRYECRISTGGHMLNFHCNDTDAILGIVGAVCDGAQVSSSIRLTVIDTASRGCPRSSLGAETCLGFAEAAEAFLNALNMRRSRPVREGEGRDVVVEVQFAAHDATLEQCREFAQSAVAVALDSFAQHPPTPRQPCFGHNGDGVGEAWFQ